MPTIFHYNHPFILESGKKLSAFHLAYTAIGNLNKEGNNVVWVFHALTANSDPAEWWYGLIGEDKFFDPAEYFIVCVNMPGSCYGSIGPLDMNPATGSAFFHDFPVFTTRDMVRAYNYLKESLGIRKIHVGLGGSMGGQQLLEWAVEEPDLFEYIFPIATNAKHSPWGIAFNATQRHCIENDVSWKNNDENAGLHGMKIARAIALLSYRNYNTYFSNQTNVTNDTANFPVDEQVFRAETYQRYQGEKLAKRFNAFSYHVLSKSMDYHDLGRGRNSIEDALKKIKAKTLVIGIRSDILFPIQEQKFIKEHIPDADIEIIDSPYGHDGFLLEFAKLTSLMKDFKTKKKSLQLNE
ncbi:MAG: homoserine O-acetyltransferase family protein [Chitinophagaceae bacterium]